MLVELERLLVPRLWSAIFWWTREATTVPIPLDLKNASPAFAKYYKNKTVMYP